MAQASTEFEAIIGLEVHAQLATRTKMFCPCPTTYGLPPNAATCPVCLGLPGALPVPNRYAVELAIRAGIALNCTIRRTSRFARKNYFYPDLAKGYQITQHDLPINEKGWIEINTPNGTKRIGITRIHLEEDAAKNLHGVGGATDTLVDFNRAGIPLIEIVSEPDIRTGEEGEAYLRTLREILMFLGINDGNLEEGSFRCDANISVRPKGSNTFGTRVELKNINSFKFVRKAVDHEIARQIEVIRSGGTVLRETRTWSSTQDKTISLRSKEEAHDYRYFADPDLPPLVIDEGWIEEVRRTMPELPSAKRSRWQKEWGI
ncbi:MAG: Asp-tRNA(Asn)/Glu-tRNA(Gln) amidotransferase subunit GatB, partial [Sandaracinaceae bacterium]|nr:Asp-tRNA(Asn)/Glu-tRNA(Gln) amidotransferase subunit GatB [Sandaracinaceae bacterium]